MHIDEQKYSRNGKKYHRVLLRNSYRVDGKVKHDTIANLSSCSDDEIQAFKLALKHKGKLDKIGSIKESLSFTQGSSVGAAWLLRAIANRTGLIKALGHTREAKLILWLVMATLIEQGSRLSATRLAQRHAACDILNIEEGFNEEHLYSAMDWLELKQTKIEDRLFKQRYKDENPDLYLYDVTSSYFEGKKNELAAFGYNRDKKQGKLQIVVGLMTDVEGSPIAVEVFEGNTSDPSTVENQIKKLAERFNVKRVTLVGDRGMIKSKQIEELHSNDFNYITAITKVQMEKLLKEKVFQLDFFDENLKEVEHEGIRYFLRKNPVREKEIQDARQSKIDSITKCLAEQNKYLQEHPKASVDKAKQRVESKIKKLLVNKFLSVSLNDDNELICNIDEDKLSEIAKLDGCYVIKTDLEAEDISDIDAHGSYKNLAHVENAFRTMKTGLLELRPIFVRKASRTRAHVFIIMLAYMLEHELRKCWRSIDITVEEGISELSALCSINVEIKESINYQTIPQPRDLTKELLKKAEVKLPTILPCRNANVHTRKKLTSER